MSQQIPNFGAVPPAASVGAGASRPPVVLLGGEANALSVARQLRRIEGVEVFVIGEEDSAVKRSRYCRWIPVPIKGTREESWARFLLGADSEHLRGAVVLACSDAGIQVIARNREALLARYRLDESNPVAQLAMLDKLSTYRLALAAGIPTPGFWVVESRQQAMALKDSLHFPLIVKPRLSHIFEMRFGRKFVFASNFDQVLTALDTASEAGIDVLLMEWIAGPDHEQGSYYTYLDETGTPLFHFTKRVFRRYPVGMGGACYHITDWVPELLAPALALFKQAGLRGLAHVDFKRDQRDGQYKLIECNARFTAANCLVAASGFDLAAFVYNRITGLPQQRLDTYKLGLRLWEPARDWLSFLELRRRGQLTLPGWIASIMHRQTFPYFSWSDPMPSLYRLSKPLTKLLNSKKAFGVRPASGVPSPVSA